ncbi:uncharacterized protein BDW43DRAFT_47791 [Aspergillus alliaceus]|uniref:uncharacterized protein n=1 Tax=Petromyces alliaceus TaxID=209559 RepID=UPI0012A4C61B|nr:uncharacterized protein BDW43DRAFT_47791 [Aspergillus alliaceus]KAB8234953.1 hypothetical protein BDW43DRAFT_47791 [Aspergillus alliaceus]
MSPVDTTPFPIWPRDFVSDLKSAPETLSSWDNCMAKSYCKWPVIVAIIVGGVIVISILACIINCLCCGIQCCKCCGCCSCCCPSPRRKKEPKYLDEPYNQPPPQMPPPPVNNPYQPPPPPVLPTYRGAQVARFDNPPSPANSKGNEDALPAMPTWDSAITKRVEDPSHHQDAMEMEPLNLSNQKPRRTPSVPQLNGGGGAYMGPPPLVRTGTAFTSSSYYPDDQSAYRTRSPGVASPGPVSPYEQSYGDYSHAYASQPHYMPIGTALSPSADASPAPYRQPSPAISHAPGMALSTDGARPIPYRQPSPGIHQSPINRTMSPANSAPSYRALTPGNSTPVYQAMTSPSQEPVYRAMSPPNQEAAYRAMPPPNLQSAYKAMPPPNSEPAYRAMPPPLNTEPVFRDTSPSIPSSPPPPFTSSPAPHEMIHDSGRPPSLLQSGRKAVPNSSKDV